MSNAPISATPADGTVFVEARDLPIYCPGPNAPVWSMHPRVYIEVAKTGKAMCPYCGAAYQLKDGEKVHDH